MSNVSVKKPKSQVWRKFSDGFVRGAGKLGNQRHLAALRDAFALFTPLIIAGSIAVVMRTFVFGAAGGASTSILGWIAHWTHHTNAVKQTIDPTTGQVVAASWELTGNFGIASNIGNFAFYTINTATYELIAVYFAFGLGYFVARSRNNDSPVIAGLTTLAIVMAANGSIGWAAPKYVNAEGLMTAILIGFPTAELFCLLSKSKRLLIKMPAGVPPAVARSFAKLFPILILGLGISVLNIIFMSVGYVTNELTTATGIAHYGGYTMTIGDAIFYGIQSPFLKVASNTNADLGIALVYALSISLLWFFGIHGSNVMNGVFGPLYIILLTQNINGADHVFVQGTWDAFVFLGGTGATMGWILSTFLFSRRKADKEIAKFGAPAGIFQINEPIIFGAPMVANPILAVPFILSTPILVITTYIAIHSGMVPKVTVWIPWTTPAPIGGLLATSMSWRGIILALFNLAIAILLYIPFVLVANKKAKKDGEELSVALVKFGKRTSEEKEEIAANNAAKKEAKAAKKEAKAAKKGEK